jgi:hypothetical protein
MTKEESSGRGKMDFASVSKPQHLSMCEGHTLLWNKLEVAQHSSSAVVLVVVPESANTTSSGHEQDDTRLAVYLFSLESTIHIWACLLGIASGESFVDSSCHDQPQHWSALVTERVSQQESRFGNMRRIKHDRRLCTPVHRNHSLEWILSYLTNTSK